MRQAVSVRSGCRDEEHYSAHYDYDLSPLWRELKYSVRQDLERVIAELIANIFRNIPPGNIFTIMQEDKFSWWIMAGGVSSWLIIKHLQYFGVFERKKNEVSKNIVQKEEMRGLLYPRIYHIPCIQLVFIKKWKYSDLIPIAYQTHRMTSSLREICQTGVGRLDDWTLSRPPLMKMA